MPFNDAWAPASAAFQWAGHRWCSLLCSPHHEMAHTLGVQLGGNMCSIAAFWQLQSSCVRVLFELCGQRTTWRLGGQHIAPNEIDKMFWCNAFTLLSNESSEQFNYLRVLHRFGQYLSHLLSRCVRAFLIIAYCLSVSLFSVTKLLHVCHIFAQCKSIDCLWTVFQHGFHTVLPTVWYCPRLM